MAQAAFVSTSHNSFKKFKILKSLLKLPLFESNNTYHPKSNTYNNTAYIDSFFTYLSSKLLHDHGFVNGMDFYGSFLAKKSDFRINIVDDIEYLNDFVFLHKLMQYACSSHPWGPSINYVVSKSEITFFLH